MNTYELPKLPYGYTDLVPFISEKLLRIHHDKHHQAYVNAANKILEDLAKSRKDKTPLDQKATLKALSFNVGGAVLHSLFWNNMAKKPSAPAGKILEAIKTEFGSFDRFKEEFSAAALSVEGSGWAALAYDDTTKRLIISQIEKHNINLYPGYKLLLVLDVWEHAYYLDYENDRAKFIEGFFNVINWDEVNKRLIK